MDSGVTPIRPQLHMFDDMPLYLNEAFIAYHDKYPKVYETFKKYTLIAINQLKHKHFSARGVFQVMRYYNKDI